MTSSSSQPTRFIALDVHKHYIMAGAIDVLPTVWVPPEPVRALRMLVAQRQRLIRQRTRARNRLQSVLQRHNWLPPTGALFGSEQRTGGKPCP